MHRPLSAALTITALLGLVATARAQIRPPGRTFCWTAHPAPACRLFLVTNIGVYGTTSGGWDTGAHLVADWGLMVNASDRDAVGLSYAAAVRSDLSVEAGPVLRYRRWISAESAAEIGLAFLENSPFTNQEYHLGWMLKYSPTPWLGFALRPSSRSTLLGIEIGAVPGLVLSLVAAPVLGGVALGNWKCC